MRLPKKNSPNSWHNFWEGKTTPLHKKSNEDQVVSYAEELKILFNSLLKHNNEDTYSVLDLGCGNGELFKPLGFDSATKYRGIDFSDTMLGYFKNNFTDANLIKGDVSTYKDDDKYDLIFCNGVIQYLDTSQINNLLINCKSMMLHNSVLVLASIPWRKLRSEYYFGRFSKIKTSYFTGAATMIKRVFKDSMGRWYQPSEVINLAKNNGFDLDIYGSLHYPYRFHIVAKTTTNK